MIVVIVIITISLLFYLELRSNVQRAVEDFHDRPRPSRPERLGGRLAGCKHSVQCAVGEDIVLAFFRLVWRSGIAIIIAAAAAHLHSEEEGNRYRERWR